MENMKTETRMCSRCGENPRTKYHPWCNACLTLNSSRWKRNQMLKRQEQGASNEYFLNLQERVWTNFDALLGADNDYLREYLTEQTTTSIDELIGFTDEMLKERYQ